ncbi:MAG: hypothetical protein JWN56_2375 [Sphingobacteriales bacterium]|nr:hypothetical protein [Sphingobacteriales bacterium]
MFFSSKYLIKKTNREFITKSKKMDIKLQDLVKIPVIIA